MKRGDIIFVSGDSSDLWIQGYNVRVSTDAVVEKTPNRKDKKVLLTLFHIDGDSRVCTAVRKSKIIEK